MPHPSDEIPDLATALPEEAERRRAAGVRAALQVVHKVLNPEALAPRLAAGDFVDVQKDLWRVNVEAGQALSAADVRTLNADEERLLTHVQVATYTRKVEDLPVLLLATSVGVNQFLTEGEPRT